MTTTQTKNNESLWKPICESASEYQVNREPLLWGIVKKKGGWKYLTLKLMKRWKIVINWKSLLFLYFIYSESLILSFKKVKSTRQSLFQATNMKEEVEFLKICVNIWNQWTLMMGKKRTSNDSFRCEKLFFNVSGLKKPCC